MDRYKETFETWNKVASCYQEKFMDLNIYNETYDLICTGIENKHAKILDVGCGPGNITQYLLSNRPDFDVLGIDIAPNMIALAQENNPNARFAIMDCREIDQLKSKFDAIVCGFCLPYMSTEACAKFIENCAQLLTENGLIYLSFVEGDPTKSDFQVSSTGDRVFFNFHDLAELTEQLRASHFHEIQVHHVNYQKSAHEQEKHTVVVGRKGF